jgi:nucleoside-diphosphate-sugar epimerase
MNGAIMKRIMVTGASGFIGRNMVSELIKRGYSVTAFDFNGSAKVELEGKFGSEVFTFVQGDVRNSGDVAKACAGADAVIHLAGAIRISDYQANYDIHVKGAENIIDSCKKEGIGRIIAYSSVAASKEKPGAYGSTKKQSEEVFFKSGLDVTILRPTMVIGPGCIGLATIVKQVRAYPLAIPLIGSGKSLRQPVYVKDIVNVTINSLDNSQSFGKSYGIGGKDTIPFKELVSVVRREVRVKKFLVPVPAFIPKLVARGLELAYKNPPFTHENVNNLTSDEKVDIEPARNELGFNPVPLSEVLPKIARSFR